MTPEYEDEVDEPTVDWPPPDQPGTDLFGRVAERLRAGGTAATARQGGGGLPVVEVDAGDGTAWTFGAHPESLLWAGDYYVGGAYWDSVEAAVRTDSDDPEAIAAALRAVVGRPPGADSLAEMGE
jgi:hypothetical protein